MKRLFSLLLALAMIFTLAACSGKDAPTLTWEEQYDLGLRYLEEGDYEAAILAFHAAIKIDPKHAEAYTSLADAYIATGNYTQATEALSRGREVCGDQEAFTRLENILSFMESGQTGIRITDFYFDKSAFLSGNETSFLVSVAYRCPADMPCILMIGANTDEPQSFSMLEEDFAVTGEGSYRFRVSLTPTSWENDLFGIYVNLSEADHGDSWTPLGSDTMYIDENGNTVSGDAWYNDGSYEDDYGDYASRSVSLPAFEEITYLGRSIAGLTISEAQDLAVQNGFTITSNSDWENSNDYWWFMGDQRNYGATLSVLQYFDDDICALVNYTHYTHDDGPGLSIGIRDICTHDSIETVLTKLDLPQVLEASARVADIAATYPYEEAATMIQQDQSFNFFDPDQQASLHFGGSLTGAGDENGVVWISAWGFSMYYEVDGINYSIDFEFEENMLTNVWCHIHA